MGVLEFEHWFVTHQGKPTSKAKGRGRTAAAVSEPSETELHLGGLLYIAYLLANNEVSACAVALLKRVQQPSCHTSKPRYQGIG